MIARRISSYRKYTIPPRSWSSDNPRAEEGSALPHSIIHAQDRYHRRDRDLQPGHLRDHRGGLPRHTLRKTIRPHPHRKDQRGGGRVPLPPREAAPVPAHQRPLQGQHVGAEGARMQVHHLRLRRRVPAGGVRPRRPGHRRPVHRLHEEEGLHLLRRQRGAHLHPRPVLPLPQLGLLRDRSGYGHQVPPRRDLPLH